MKTAGYNFSYEEYASIDELNADDGALLKQAREITNTAYAPYSKFNVGALALLVNGAQVAGTNQENAAYPVGICAERVLLGSAAVLHPGIAIETIAITYHNTTGGSGHPISPCGMCRQALVEFEERTQHPIRLILSGMDGKVLIIHQAGSLLPLSFKGNDLK
jgi:cytidine deaminase